MGIIMNALEIKNLTKSYKGFKLDNVSFTLPEGCIMGLIGENGAGKSTIINLIMDLVRRDSGEIYVLGKDNRTDFAATKEDIGVVLDDAGFPESLDIVMAEKIMKRAYKRWDSEKYYGLIEKFNLPRKKAVKEFSRGMKMKLYIAAALSHNPRLLILDEATSGLDPIVRDEILDIFYEFIEEGSRSILISSHIISDLEKLCDYITFIHRGKLLLSEEKDKLKEKYSLVKMGKDEFSRLDKAVVLGSRISDFGVEALVETKNVPEGVQAFPPGVEDIILYLAKGEK